MSAVGSDPAFLAGEGGELRQAGSIHRMGRGNVAGSHTSDYDHPWWPRGLYDQQDLPLGRSLAALTRRRES